MTPVQKPLRPQPGSQIDPRNAVGRVRTTQKARQALLEGNNLLLNDPRRMGKTVWLDMFCLEPGDGLTAVKIDYEGVQSSEEFLLRTVDGLSRHRGMPSKAREKINALFDRFETVGPITIRAGVASRSRTELLAETIRGIDDHVPQGTTLVIAMDEVPIAIANIAAASDGGPDEAGRLLQTLRQLRRRDSKLRWIVCGSIGFHHVLRHCNSTEGAVNDLINLPLGPLELEEAKELAGRLLLGIERPGDTDVINALVAQAGAIPFLLHALTHRLDDTGDGPVTVDHVSEAFMDFLDERDESKAVTHLLTRLEPALQGADERRKRAARSHRVARAGQFVRARFRAARRSHRRPLPGAEARQGVVAVRGPTQDLDAPAALDMSSPRSRFTPSLMPHELLERLFVAREQTLDRIIDRVKAAAASDERNHTLLVGPRGSGKTHLVSLAYYRTRALPTPPQVAWLPEDPWTIVSYQRLLREIGARLEPKIAEVPSTTSELEAALVERANSGGPIVVFVENLDQILDALGNDGQQQLRHLLQAHRPFLLVATTTRIDRSLSDQAEPFYGFFTTTRLKPFDAHQAAAMLSAIATANGDRKLVEYLASDEGRRRLQTIAHLAGGQPRIWALLASALDVAKLDELVELLLTRFDDLTPYYQEQLTRLSGQQRLIVAELAEADRPINVGELAERLDIDQRSLSKTVSELVERGWLMPTSSALTEEARPAKDVLRAGRTACADLVPDQRGARRTAAARRRVPQALVRST